MTAVCVVQPLATPVLLNMIFTDAALGRVSHRVTRTLLLLLRVYCGKLHYIGLLKDYHGKQWYWTIWGTNEWRLDKVLVKAPLDGWDGRILIR